MFFWNKLTRCRLRTWHSFIFPTVNQETVGTNCFWLYRGVPKSTSGLIKPLTTIKIRPPPYAAKTATQRPWGLQSAAATSQRLMDQGLKRHSADKVYG